MQHVNKDLMTLDKEVLYNMVSREIANSLQGIPFFSAFAPTISSWVIAFIDPYIDAFTLDNNKVNTKQLASFVSQELAEKVNKFKAQYEEEVHDHEN